MKPNVGLPASHQTKIRPVKKEKVLKGDEMNGDFEPSG